MTSSFDIKVVNHAPVLFGSVSDFDNVKLGKRFEYTIPENLFTDQDGDKIVYKVQ